MAILLAMFQKMRLVREKNLETYNLTKYSSKLSRVTKNIERIQKMYTSRMSTLESNAKRMQNAASIFFQNQFGLGTGSINTNMYSYLGGGQLTGFMLNSMAGMFNGGDTYQYGKESGDQISKSDFEKFLKIYQAYGQQGVLCQVDENGVPTKDADGKAIQLEGAEAAKAQAFLSMVQNASMMQSQAQMQLSTVNQSYQDNISIWLEAAKAELEAQQDEALLPLQEEETMLELDKTASEERLTRIKAELESYTQLVSEEAKDSAPKFGL